ncbi:hypothetical protein [Spirillospora sp. CA-294931]|uniref:hypothetical protein n=1 Tax=Spirillospora sp. CA-294931 TaxID=3240042 RepID=UPI003D91C8FB
MTMTKSPRRLKQQVRDSVGEQVRDLPLHAVRLAMFGVGRALLLSDRMTKDYKEITEGGGVKPVLGRLRDDVQVTAGKVVGRVVDKVRGGEDAEPERATARATVQDKPAAKPVTRSAAKPADKEIAVGKPGAEPVAKPAPEPAAEPAPKAAPSPRPDPAPETAGQAEPKPKPETTPTPKPEVKPASGKGSELPVPNYDEATLPQLRARLRGLSVDQVKLLRAYEEQHAARADVLKMYENRVAKLNGHN